MPATTAFPCDHFWLRPVLVPPIKSSVPAYCQESSCSSGNSQEIFAGAQDPDLVESEARGSGPPAIAPICFPFVRQLHRRSRNPAAICNSRRSAQPFSYHRMLPSLFIPVSAPRSQDKSQSMHGERGRVVVLRREGPSVFGKEEQEVAAAPAIHSPTATYTGIGPSVAGQPRT